MMRKVLYIVGFLLFVSCNQFSPKAEKSAVKEEAVEADSKGWANIDKTNFKTTDFSLENINSEIQEKLQANYEAQLLATKHPEFAEAIKEQLANSNKFTEALSDSIQTIKIKDIKLIGSMETRNDSVSTQKMIYTSLINSTYKQKDSALVVVKRKTIVIDNAVKVNTSFSFESLDR